MKPCFMAASHGLLAVLLFVQLGLTSYATSLGTTTEGYKAPTSIIFMLGNTVWSILALGFISIAPLVLSYAYHNLVALLLLALATVFWMGGSIAVASILARLFETSRAGYVISQPIVAFSFFIWVAFAGLMSLEVVGILKGAYRNDIQDVIDLHGMDDDRARHRFN